MNYTVRNIRRIISCFGSGLICMFWLFSAKAVQESEPNNAIGEANEIQLGDSVQGLFSPAHDGDWYKLTSTVAEKHLINVHLTAVPGIDSRMEIRDADNQILCKYDVHKSAEPETALRFGIESGVYYIIVSARDFNENDRYTLSIESIGHWQEGTEFESNDSCQRPNLIQPDTTVKGYFYPDYDSDQYFIETGGLGESIGRFTLSGVPKLNTWIEVYSPDCKEKLIHCDSGRVGEPEQVINLGLGRYEYILSVACPARENNPDAMYEFTLETLKPWDDSMEFEPNHNVVYANRIVLGKTVSGNIHPDRDADWFVFSIPKPGLDILVITVSALPKVNIWIELMDAQGAVLKRGDIRRDGESEEMIRMKVGPGDYFVAVHGYGENPDESYTLRVGEPIRGPASQEEVRKALRNALNYLVTAQTEDGFLSGEYGQNAGMVSLALMALVGAECVEENYDPAVSKLKNFILSQYHSPAQYQPETVDWMFYGGMIGNQDLMYSHAISTLALTEILVETGDYSLEPIIDNALQLILRTQNTSHKPELLNGPIPESSSTFGGWRYQPDTKDGDLSVSGWQILAVKACENAGFPVPEWSKQCAARFVRNCYNDKKGAFNYQPGKDGIGCGRTAIGALSLQICGFPDDPLIQPSIDFMFDNPPVWEVEQPGPGWPFYYWYYGTRVMMNRGGEELRIWKSWMCRLLVDNQSLDGSWDLSQEEHRRTSRCYTASLGALMLELCCGHIPIYMRETGSLQVIMEGEEQVTDAPRTIELILDASGSMWGQINGIPKIAIAKEVLTSIIGDLPDDVHVGLRIYGHQHHRDKRNCTDSQLVVPVGLVNKPLLMDKINGINPRGMTPIAYSLEQAAHDLSGIEGGKVIILVSDGKESCEGDPVSVAKKLADEGLDMTFHVVGFDIADETTREQLKMIARVSNGRYLDASDADELKSALKEVVRMTYTVYDEKGKSVYSDIVGTNPHRLKTGRYRVVIQANPPIEVPELTVEENLETEIVLIQSNGKLEAILK